MAVVDAARERDVPIRVGVNSGSLEKEIIEKYGGVTADGLVESALDKVHWIESMDYNNLVVSIKSSDVLMCAEAYEKFAQQSDYPLHVGITEAGTVISGNIKSAVGLALILSKGIGDTIRVSLSGDPVEEIRSAKLILRTLGLREGGIEVVSCPTCGRTQIDLISLANQVEQLVQSYPLNRRRSRGGSWHRWWEGRGTADETWRDHPEDPGIGVSACPQVGTGSLGGLRVNEAVFLPVQKWEPNRREG